MKLFLKKDIVKILIILIFVVLLLWVIWANEIKSYSTLDKYVQKNNNFITSAEIVASNYEYALIVENPNGIFEKYNILIKNEKGNWKQLNEGWDYDVQYFEISDIFSKIYFNIDAYYIKSSNITILFIYKNKYFMTNEIEEVNDSKISNFYKGEISYKDEKLYTYTAFIKDFNSKEYTLYINGHIYTF